MEKFSSFMTLEEFEADVLQRGDSLWFLELVKYVKYLQNEKKLKITDVYIQERKPISIGILKSFLPMPMDNNFKILAPNAITSDKIWKLVLNLYSKRLTQIGHQPNKAPTIASEQMMEKNVLSFSFAIQDVGVMRFTFSKSQNGLVLTFRLLPFTVPSFAFTGLDKTPIPYLLNTMSKNIEIKMGDMTANIKTFNAGGIIIHCGATGSGKSTSIASQIQQVAKTSAGMVITYEDPVEYRFEYPNVLQYEIPNNISYEEIYHHFLRSTAQVCLIGEIRTRETLIHALDIANRGHLVYTTFHANSVVEAIYTMKSMLGTEYLNLLLNALKGVIYQKLKLVNNNIVPMYEMLLLYEDETSDIKNFVNTIKVKIEKEPAAGLESYLQDNIKSLRSKNIYWSNMDGA